MDTTQKGNRLPCLARLAFEHNPLPLKGPINYHNSTIAILQTRRRDGEIFSQTADSSPSRVKWRNLQWKHAPPHPRFFSKSCSFQAILSTLCVQGPLPDQNSGSAPESPKKLSPEPQLPLHKSPKTVYSNRNAVTIRISHFI